MTIIQYTHPAFCDPRLCASSPSNLFHRGAPMVWALGCGITVTVGLSQTDEIGRFYGPGTPHVSLGLRDEESVTKHGDNIEVDDAWLDSAGARLLSAALVCFAEQLEELQGQQVTR